VVTQCQSHASSRNVGTLSDSIRQSHVRACKHSGLKFMLKAVALIRLCCMLQLSPHTAIYMHAVAGKCHADIQAYLVVTCVATSMNSNLFSLQTDCKYSQIQCQRG